jgi:hypothetical protein
MKPLTSFAGGQYGPRDQVKDVPVREEPRAPIENHATWGFRVRARTSAVEAVTVTWVWVSACTRFRNFRS